VKDNTGKSSTWLTSLCRDVICEVSQQGVPVQTHVIQVNKDLTNSISRLVCWWVVFVFVCFYNVHNFKKEHLP